MVLKLEFRGACLTVAELAQLSGVQTEVLRRRLADGWTTEQAVCIPSVQQRRRGAVVNIVPPFIGPGVPSNFEAFEGTGAGSTAQESPEITFPHKAETA